MAKEQYPTRLLDCGSPESALNSACRLIETDSVAVTGPYLTLSHCWGVAECLKLTTDNRSELLEAIPFASLPQLYQDAVSATRQLGIRYLWIDSLCIIQSGNNHSDWLKEVGRMGNIYSNSYCNLSAANASDCHHSMVYNRNAEVITPQIVSLSVRDRTDQYLMVDQRFWETEVSKALVNTRAWVLQERLLSPRILYFGARQLLWECHELDAAEIYPEGLPPPPVISGSGTHFKDMIPRNDTATKSGLDIAKHQVWRKVVGAYTACALTYPSDKLAAISSVAKMMRTYLDDEYVAGLWRRYLERELLWSVSGRPSRRFAEADAYRAPSWSWAAVDGHISTGVLDIDPADVLIEIESVHLEYLTDDNTGFVTAGWLELWGVLKQLKLAPRPSTGRVPDAWEMAMNGWNVTRWAQPLVMLDNIHKSFDRQNTEALLYCMPGRIAQKADGHSILLLLELVDRQKGIFRRIGIAHGWGEDMKSKIMSPSTDDNELPCVEYRDGLHRIRII
ncbi:hypothetical protein DL767_006879 [Monosporascus sp. MG133]|nr:hypothetical protein DL767_006879 [Monosporascus sp. MG133]